jgi:hypothetical protein
MPITRNKLRNSIIASKIDINTNDIDATCKLITKQLSQSHLLPVINTTVYHMESLYRDNSNDKYYFSKQKNKYNSKC